MHFLCHLRNMVGTYGLLFIFVRRLSVCLSACLSVHHTFSSRFQITFFLLKGLDWNFWQMFISIFVMDSQKGDNPNIFISELLPLFCFLTISHIKTLSDASAADDFWIHFGQGSWWSISSFVTMFSTLFNN